MSPADEVAQLLCRGVTDSCKNSASTTKAVTQFIHQPSRVPLGVSDLEAYLEQHRGKDRVLERVPLLKWVGRIKRRGFKYLLTTQELS